MLHGGCECLDQLGGGGWGGFLILPLFCLLFLSPKSGCLRVEFFKKSEGRLKKFLVVAVVAAALVGFACYFLYYFYFVIYKGSV